MEDTLTLPLLSIVIPTRDRPELLRYALESLKANDLNRIEIIVTDNPTQSPALDVFNDYAQSNWHYIRPDTELSMCDNWEAGLAAATGEYVSVMTDKMTFLPGALQIIVQILEQEAPEIINWAAEFFALPKTNLTDGAFFPGWSLGAPRSYSPRDAAQTMTSMLVPTGKEAQRYYWGKICFGAYSRELIERVTSKYGRMFYEVSPDFTATVAALSEATKAIDVGRPLMMAFLLPEVSNGMMTMRSTAATKRFYTTIPNAEDWLKRLPVPELEISIHNSLARDYITMAELGAASAVQDESYMDRFALLIAQDLEMIFWDDAGERAGAVAELAGIFERQPNLAQVPSSAFVSSELVKPFDVQMQQHLDDLRANQPQNASQCENILIAGQVAADHYLTDFQDIACRITHYDTREIDMHRATLGPIYTLLLDHLFTRAHVDVDARNLLALFIEALASEAETGLSVLTIDPSPDVLATLALFSKLKDSPFARLPERMQQGMDAGWLNIQDLVSTTLSVPAPSVDVRLEALCQRLREGKDWTIFAPWMIDNSGVTPDELMALYIYIDRYGPLNAETFEVFKSEYWPSQPDANTPPLIDAWFNGLVHTNAQNHEGTSDEACYWALRASSLKQTLDWKTLFFHATDSCPNGGYNYFLGQYYAGLAAYNVGALDLAQTHIANAVSQLQNNQGNVAISNRQIFAKVYSQVWHLQGVIARDAGKIIRAEDALIRALNFAEEHYGTDDWRIISHLSELVTLYTTPKPALATQLQTRIADISEAVFGPESPATQMYREQVQVLKGL